MCHKLGEHIPLYHWLGFPKSPYPGGNFITHEVGQLSLLEYWDIARLKGLEFIRNPVELSERARGQGQGQIYSELAYEYSTEYSRHDELPVHVRVFPNILNICGFVEAFSSFFRNILHKLHRTSLCDIIADYPRSSDKGKTAFQIFSRFKQQGG